MTTTVIFDYDPKDHYIALREVTKRTKARWIALAFIIVMGVFAAWTFWSEIQLSGPFAAFISALPWILLATFWLFFIPIMQRRNAKKLPKLDPGVTGPQMRGVDSEGFHSEGNGVTLNLPWRVMHRAVETPDVFLFFYNKNCAYYIPKRVMSNEQVAQIRQVITGALADRATLLV